MAAQPDATTGGAQDTRDPLDLVAQVVALSGAVAVGVRPSFDPDTFWHLAAGRWMVEHGSILSSDPFSFTRAGAPWPYPGWLTDVAMHAVYAAAGWPGIHLATGVAFVAAVAVLWRLLVGPPVLRALLCLLATLVAATAALPRPLVLSFLLTAVFLWLLERSPDRLRLLLWLPPLMVLWANLHGGFVLGLVLVGAYLVGAIIDRRRFREQRDQLTEQVRWLAWIGLASAIAVMASPRGPGLLLYPIETLRLGVLGEFVEEWQAPDFSDPTALPLLLLLVLAVVSLAGTRRRVRGAEVVLVVAFGYLAVTAYRHAPPFALVVTPIVARHLSAMVARRGAREPTNEVSAAAARGLNVALITVSVLAAAILAGRVLVPSEHRAGVDRYVAVEAIDHLATSELPGPVFHEYGWGAYLIWRWYPSYRPFIDGRTDLYGDEFVTTWADTRMARPGWDEVLDRWDIQTVALYREAPLLQVLDVAGWERAYEDDEAVILVRP